MRPIRFFFTSLAVLAVLSGATILTACTDEAPQLIESDTSYTKDSATALLSDADAGELATKPADDAAEQRQEALADLRGEGDLGNEAADLITKNFPSSNEGVPFYVERARYDGQTAWVIIEALGRRGGTLDDRRLWVLTPDGDVLLSVME